MEHCGTEFVSFLLGCLAILLIPPSAKPGPSYRGSGLERFLATDVKLRMPDPLLPWQVHLSGTFARTCFPVFLTGSTEVPSCTLSRALPVVSLPFSPLTCASYVLAVSVRRLACTIDRIGVNHPDGLSNIVRESQAAGR